MQRPVVHLVVMGASSRIESSQCAACPHAPAGCCTGPPPYRWADVGRVVALGGRDWLSGEIAAGRIRPSRDGLTLVRRRGLARTGGPRVAKCVHHGATGCDIAAEKRPAACNYYVCDEALGTAGTGEAAGEAGADEARALHAEMARRMTGLNEALAERLDRRIEGHWPGGIAFDAAFLDWLGAEFAALEAAYSTNTNAPRHISSSVVSPSCTS